MDDLFSNISSIILMLSQLDKLLADRRLLGRWIRFSVSHDQDQCSPLIQAGTCVFCPAEELLTASQISAGVQWPSAAFLPDSFDRSV